MTFSLLSPLCCLRALLSFLPDPTSTPARTPTPKSTPTQTAALSLSLTATPSATATPTETPTPIRKPAPIPMATRKPKLRCHLCYSANSWEHCDKESKVVNCAPGFDEACLTMTLNEWEKKKWNQDWQGTHTLPEILCPASTMFRRSMQRSWIAMHGGMLYRRLV